MWKNCFATTINVATKISPPLLPKLTIITITTTNRYYSSLYSSILNTSTTTIVKDFTPPPIYTTETADNSTITKVNAKNFTVRSPNTEHTRSTISIAIATFAILITTTYGSFFTTTILITTITTTN